MYKQALILSIGFIASALVSCMTTNSESSNADEKQNVSSEEIVDVMTRQMQDELTPDLVLKDLLDGNERYVSGDLLHRNLPKQITATTNGQYPKAVVLACIDSRVPVEYIFDQGIGDIFVVRVAGNIENEELLGSMEYGLGVAGSKLLMVLGHENCGAVKSAISQVDVGSDNVTSLLNEIEPAIQEVGGERNAKDKNYFDHVVMNNVHETIEDIRERSSIIRDLEAAGKAKVVGAYYSLTDGQVKMLENDPHPGHKH